VDLTAGSDGEPPTKKTRTSSSRGTPPTSTVVGSSGTAEQWRYTPTSPDKLDTHPIKQRAEVEVLAQKGRREAFKNKLLLENNPFLRKKADTLVACIELDESESGSEESDHAFKELNEMFSNKAKGKTKVSIPTKPSKKPVVMGPSGQSYTPLENQASTTFSGYQQLIICSALSLRFYNLRKRIQAHCLWSRSDISIGSLVTMRRYTLNAHLFRTNIDRK